MMEFVSWDYQIYESQYMEKEKNVPNHQPGSHVQWNSQVGISPFWDGSLGNCNSIFQLCIAMKHCGPPKKNKNSVLPITAIPLTHGGARVRWFEESGGLFEDRKQGLTMLIWLSIRGMDYASDYLPVYIGHALKAAKCSVTAAKHPIVS